MTAQVAFTGEAEAMGENDIEVATRCYIIRRKCCHCKAHEGRQSSKIQKWCYELSSLLTLSEVPFIQGLQTFSAVIAAMFGKPLKSQYADSLKVFALAFVS